MGGSGKALPEPRSELRAGVGLVHSTCEVVEGNETHGGKGPARGEPAREGQGPDTEPGCLAAEPRTGEHGSQAGCPNPVHGLAAPRRRGRTASGVSTTKAAGQRGGRRDNGGEVRREAHGYPPGALRTRPHGSLPATAGATSLHPQSRWR